MRCLMALPEECGKGSKTVCIDCGTELNIRVLSSAAGYYIGFLCSQCGPYSRESGYYRTREAAETDLDLGFPDRF